MDAINVQHITKIYRIGVGRARVREMLPWPFDAAVSRLFPRWWARNTFKALDDISLLVPSGSSIGIVGHNGAGKTTLLRVIAGVTAPAAGTVSYAGRIAALIDLVVGFDPHLTGRENIYLLGAVHGLRRRVMAERIDQILEFAEIGEMTDTPLKRYSAGMAARLGFATLTALDADIMLVDEVLAVGDSSFQRKCIQWLDDYRSRGGTLVFVSHNLGLVRSMTERVVWMDHGKLMGDGAPGEILGQYAKAMEQREPVTSGLRKGEARKLMRARGMNRWGAGGVRVEKVDLDEPSAEDSSLEVTITYEGDGVDQAMFCIGFVDESGREIGSTSSAPISLNGRSGSVTCRLSPLPLRSGIYFPIVAVVSPDGRIEDRWRLDRAIVVERNGKVEVAETLGPVDIPGVWSDA